MVIEACRSEREACAKIAEAERGSDEELGLKIAARIRARRGEERNANGGY